MASAREEEDFALALALQELWDAEDAAAVAAEAEEAEDEDEVFPEAFPKAVPEPVPEPPAVPGPPAVPEPPAVPAPLRPLSVVDEAWELLDPNPDVRHLFAEFNETLFWGRLSAVEVVWSSRMKLCAGLCKYEIQGGMCSIRLSEPLLKLRPRKDLVETLLHEMIHALLFITNNVKDRETHGPEFCKHMHRINRLTGANVSIYHNFHDEVESYRQHWWRCNGPCQYIKPYFGYVKRSINRAPSARDLWWAVHEEKCGGTFTKVKEPENFSKKSKEKKEPAKRPKSKSTNKGKKRVDAKKDPIPFSEDDYQLGGGDGGLSEESISFISSVKNTEPSGWQHRPSGSAIPVPKNEIIFEKSPLNGISFPFYTDDTGKNMNSASKRKFPKVSVADTEVYENVDGSPVKIPRVVEEQSSQGSAKGKRAWPFYDNRPPKQICFEHTTTGEGASEKKRLENRVQQWPKNEDKTTFENYFIKKESTDTTLSINTPMKTKVESAVSSASSSATEQKEKRVSCPVCQIQVLESRINEHLDFCLE